MRGGTPCRCDHFEEIFKHIMGPVKQGPVMTEEGSTRIPKAQQPTKDLFNGRGPDEEIFKNTLGPVQQGPAKQVKDGPVMQGPATQAMEDTGLKKTQIDEGSTRISKVQQPTKDLFNGRGPDEQIFKNTLGPVKQGPVSKACERPPACPWRGSK